MSEQDINNIIAFMMRAEIKGQEALTFCTLVEKLNAIIDVLRTEGISIQTIIQKTSSLEELFINVIRKDNTDL